MKVLHASNFTDSNGTAYARNYVSGRKPSQFKAALHPAIIVRTGPRPVDIKRAERAAKKAATAQAVEDQAFRR